MTAVLTAILENQKVRTKEAIDHNDLLESQNKLLGEQNVQINALANATKRIDDFNRMVYSATSGYQVPDSSGDEKAMQDFQETQQKEMSAVNEMYYSDISIGRDEEG